MARLLVLCAFLLVSIAGVAPGQTLDAINDGQGLLRAAPNDEVTFTLVKSIDVSAVAACPHDVAFGFCTLMVVGIGETECGRYNPYNGNLLGTFQVTDGEGNLVGFQDYGFDFNPNTQRLIHVYDDDAGTPFAYDAYFETNWYGEIVKGPFDLFGPGDNSEDPNGVTVDPSTGRTWVSSVDEGLWEIDPDTGEQIA